METEPKLVTLKILHWYRLRIWDEEYGLLISWLLASVWFVCSNIFPTSMFNKGFPPPKSIDLRSYLSWCIYFSMLHTSLGKSISR